MYPPVPTYLGPGWMSLIFNWGVLMCQNRSSCQPFFICTYWWSIIDGCAGVRKLEGCTDHVWWAPCRRDWSQGSQCEDNQVQRFQFEHFDCSSLSILIVLNIRQHFVPTTSLHPGVIYTDLYSNVPGIKFVSAIARWLSCLFVLADFTCVGCLSVLLAGGWDVVDQLKSEDMCWIVDWCSGWLWRLRIKGVTHLLLQLSIPPLKTQRYRKSINQVGIYN